MPAINNERPHAQVYTDKMGVNMIGNIHQALFIASTHLRQTMII